MHPSVLPTLCLLVGCTFTRPPPDCGTVRELNAAARDEALAPDQIACMSARVDHAAVSDEERRALSTLLVHAARSVDDDHATWRERAIAHVERVPDDAEVLLQLARTEQRRGPQGAEASEAWLDRIDPDSLRGDDRRDRAARLERFALLAIAAEMQAPPGAELERRQRTAERARAWIAEAQRQDLDHSRALAMCENAGLSRAWCLGDDSATPLPTAEPSP